jgi:hypothetical protein
MPTLPTDLRYKLERTCVAARNLAERAAKDALQSLAMALHEPYGHMTPADLKSWLAETELLDQNQSGPLLVG